MKFDLLSFSQKYRNHSNGTRTTEKRATVREQSYQRLPPSSVSTLRPIRIRQRLHKQRHRKTEGFSFKKDLYKMALLERASFFNGAAVKGSVRYMRKKKRGWGNAR
ncbi:hypothetical protein ANCCAN_16501 [Ancylostoma caninum]|uniref:Uncharacterized protein n=1 Tax=Ancylostoma caninum TaxID=29170 RepID=A0A368FZF3_ANCCA|nr:hypothetical protein ANCCAN_16501 [Ancylostoma caninum]